MRAFSIVGDYYLNTFSIITSNESTLSNGSLIKAGYLNDHRTGYPDSYDGTILLEGSTESLSVASPYGTTINFALNPTSNSDFYVYGDAGLDNVLLLTADGESNALAAIINEENTNNIFMFTVTTNPGAYTDMYIENGMLPINPNGTNGVWVGISVDNPLQIIITKSSFSI